MNVLILEDNKYKLENAIEVLGKHGIYDYKHFDNCVEPISSILFEKRIKEFQLIILDLNFYLLSKRKRTWRDLPTTDAGAMFLWELLEKKAKTPVIVYSSEKDYMSIFKDYPLPSSFLAYYHNFEESNPLGLSTRQTKEQYEYEKKKIEKKLLNLNFIIGHAHNEYELDFFINQFLDSINAEE